MKNYFRSGREVKYIIPLFYVNWLVLAEPRYTTESSVESRRSRYLGQHPTNYLVERNSVLDNREQRNPERILVRRNRSEYNSREAQG